MIENLTVLGWAHLYVFWFTLMCLLGGVGVVVLAGAYIWRGLEDDGPTVDEILGVDPVWTGDLTTDDYITQIRNED